VTAETDDIAQLLENVAPDRRIGYTTERSQDQDRHSPAAVASGIDHRIGRLTTVTIAALDLATLLCSRVCHDVISPVGAIMNGLEVLDSERDEDMRAVAMDLIKKSAISASARLQFCRLAFGAAGSLTAAIDTGDAENVARTLIANDRTTLRWNGERRLVRKNAVKLLLNLCLIAASAIPRGGVISVEFEGEGEALTMKIEAAGTNARLPHAAAAFLSGDAIEIVDGHSIQPYYTTLLARECGAIIRASTMPETIVLTALPAALADATVNIPRQSRGL
jgi:histidine phosphotransferase ChpT